MVDHLEVTASFTERHLRRVWTIKLTMKTKSIIIRISWARKNFIHLFSYMYINSYSSEALFTSSKLLNFTLKEQYHGFNMILRGLKTYLNLRKPQSNDFILEDITRKEVMMADDG